MSTSAGIYKRPQYYHQVQLMKQRQAELESQQVDALRLHVSPEAETLLTSTQDKTIPKRFQTPGKWNYSQRPQHPMYSTTTNDYGHYRPTIHEMPKHFHGQSSKFTEYLNMAGPYRNYSLNTKTSK